MVACPPAALTSMSPRLRPELERFRQWLGHWRGPGTIMGKDPAFVETIFVPRFEGDMLEVITSSWHRDTGQCLSTGIGYWSVGPDGKLAAAIFAAGMGGVLMREVPDDPAGVAIEGMLSGNVRFTVALLAEGETLTLTARRTEGYHGAASDLTACVMHRVVAPGGSQP